ncbi:hypothetical protein HS125_09475 [bacterium]|nr:hypothetical protein [bacterium]
MKKSRRQLIDDLARAIGHETPRLLSRVGEMDALDKLRERVKADGVEAVLPPRPTTKDFEFSYHLARAMVIAGAIEARKAQEPPLEMTEEARGTLEERLANRRRVLEQLERERLAIMLGRGRYAYEDVRRRAQQMLKTLPMEIALLEKRLSRP